MKKILLCCLILGLSSSVFAAGQETLTAIAKKSTGDFVTQLRTDVNTELAKQQRMNTELYSLTASGLPPCNNAGDIREWDGDSWECTPIIDFSVASPLSFNSTTGVLLLTPWVSQSALETWLGWTFSGSGGGITVSSSLPTTAGSAALNDSTHVLTVASDTGYTQFTGSFTAWDTIPAAFGFGTITSAVAGQEYCWTTPVTVADINRTATISSTANSYKINGTTSTATSISLGNTFTPCMVASNTAGATVSGNIIVGGVAGNPTFSVTTAAAQALIVDENFNGTGTPGGSGLTWGGSSPNYDYATTPAPLEGTHSLFIDNTDKSFNVTFNAEPVIYVAFRTYIDSTYSSANNFLYLNDETTSAILLLAPSNQILLKVNNVNSPYSGDNYYTTGQVIFIKLKFDSSTDTLTYWSSTDGTTWSNQYSYTGSGVGNISKVGSNAAYYRDIIIDTLKISTSDINF